MDNMTETPDLYLALCHDDNDEILVSCTFDSRDEMEAKVSTLFTHIVGTEYVVLYKVNGENEAGAFVSDYLTTIDKFNLIAE
jgi:hypothetical protein